MISTDNDVTRLRAEITDLEFAARSFREAANVMQAQRDEARREARALRRRVRIATVVVAMAVILVAGALAYADGAEAMRLHHLARINRATADTVALYTVPGRAESTQLSDDGGRVVYEVWVAGRDGQTHEVTVDAGNATILQQETGETAPDENDDWDPLLGALDSW